MNIITKIEAQKRNKDRANIYIDNDYAFSLSNELVYKEGLKVNSKIDIEKINKRYDIVETLLEEFILKEDLKNLLYEVYDLERLSGRIAFGNANARDLLQLKNSLKVLPDIKNILNAIDN